MVPKSKSCQIYLEISIPVILEVLSTGLTLIFKILYLKSIFRQIGPKLAPDLLENMHSRDLKGAECRSNTAILQYFIQNLNLDKLVLKLKSRPIYQQICSRVNI